LTAVTQAIQFKYDDGNTFLRWVAGDTVDPALYVIFSPADRKRQNQETHNLSEEMHRILGNMLPTHILLSSINADSELLQLDDPVSCLDYHHQYVSCEGAYSCGSH
jgi:hypothetical protein